MFKVSIVETGRLNSPIKYENNLVLLQTILDEGGLEYFNLHGDRLSSVLKLNDEDCYSLSKEGVVFKRAEDSRSNIYSCFEAKIIEFPYNVKLDRLGWLQNDIYLYFKEDELERRELWRKDLLSGSESRIGLSKVYMKVVDDSVYYRTRKGIAMVNLINGAHWDFDCEDDSLDNSFAIMFRLSEIFVVNDMALFVSGQDIGADLFEVVCLSVKTGMEIWKAKMNGRVLNFQVKGDECCITTKNQVSIISSATGELIFSRDFAIDLTTAFIFDSKIVVFTIDNSMMVFSSDLSKELCVKVFDDEYSVTANTEIVESDLGVYVTVSAEFPLSCALRGFAYFEPNEGEHVTVEKEKRPYKIGAEYVDGEKVYTLSFDTVEESKLKRFVEIGVKEITARYGNEGVYGTETVDREHKGKIHLVLDESIFNEPVRNELRRIAQEALNITRQIGISPGAGDYPKYEFSVEFVNK